MEGGNDVTVENTDSSPGATQDEKLGDGCSERKLSQIIAKNHNTTFGPQQTQEQFM